MLRPPAVCPAMKYQLPMLDYALRLYRSARASTGLLLLLLPLFGACLLLQVGCTSSPDQYDVDDSSEVAPTFSGPTYLRGTVGSYGSFTNNAPTYVGGYGMVVDLNGTGSGEVPGFLREFLINEMRRNNLGSVQFGTQRFGSERVMADLGSSVVAVEGLIPPGARRGSKFDLLVTMIDQTSTSLAGGRLFWPTQLSTTGLDRRLTFTQTLAAGYDELFVTPIAPEGEETPEFLRQAVVVNGGTVLETQLVRYVLNQSSYNIVNLVADRINARFEKSSSDPVPTAVAKTDTVIDINVPERFSKQPAVFLELIEHLYLDPTPGFVRPQAEVLARELLVDPKGRARSVVLAWKGLGPNALPAIRKLYVSRNETVRKAALEAGAWLGDGKAIRPLAQMIDNGDEADRVFAARTLTTIPRNESARMLVRNLLNDPYPVVRLGAYAALVKVNDPIIKRISIRDDTAHKFFIDRVPSEHPMVYAIQGAEQSIVIFGQDVPLHRNVFAKIDDTLTVRTLPVTSIPVGLSGRFEGDTAFVPIHRCGALKMIPSLTPVSAGEDGKAPADDWRIEIGDARGNTMLVNIRDQRLQDTVGVELLSKPNRGQATPSPRLIATVRVVRKAGKDAAGKDGPAVGELLALQDPEVQLPIAIRYQPPGETEPKVYRINPTVATFAYTLGFKRDDINSQFGPDLSFSQVVHALHSLSQQGQIPAPFYAQISPLAQSIAAAQRETHTESRPEITPEELELLEQRNEAENAPTQPGSKPAEPGADSGSEPATDAQPGVGATTPGKPIEGHPAARDGSIPTGTSASAQNDQPKK